MYSPPTLGFNDLFSRSNQSMWKMSCAVRWQSCIETGWVKISKRLLCYDNLEKNVYAFTGSHRLRATLICQVEIWIGWDFLLLPLCRTSVPVHGRNWVNIPSCTYLSLKFPYMWTYPNPSVLKGNLFWRGLLSPYWPTQNIFKHRALVQFSVINLRRGVLKYDSLFGSSKIG